MRTVSSGYLLSPFYCPHYDRHFDTWLHTSARQGKGTITGKKRSFMADSSSLGVGCSSTTPLPDLANPAPDSSQQLFFASVTFSTEAATQRRLPVWAAEGWCLMAACQVRTGTCDPGAEKHAGEMGEKAGWRFKAIGDGVHPGADQRAQLPGSHYYNLEAHPSSTPGGVSSEGSDHSKQPSRPHLAKANSL